MPDPRQSVGVYSNRSPTRVTASHPSWAQASTHTRQYVQVSSS